jgi:Protein involved in propanediol utilization, and related proteins (includes coumermycin biosynthetic protein), possible kinase
MFENQSTYRTPASCGELLQGVIEDSFALISCPVNLYNTVTIQIDTSGVIKCDSELQKSITATERTLAFLGRWNLGATSESQQPFSKSKG